MTKKKCSRCERTLPVSSFNKQNKHKDGLTYECKACIADYKRRRHLKRKAELEKIKFEGDRVCTKCDRKLHVSHFYKTTQTTDGLQKFCKDCQIKYTIAWRDANREHYNKYQKKRQQYIRDTQPEKARKLRMKRHVASKYSLTVDEYDEIMTQLNCTICNADLTERKPALDHCHATGKIRGVLCSQCNTGLGMFYDNPETLRRAAEYLS